MKRKSLRPLVEELLAVTNDGGIDITLRIDGTVVGCIQWDLHAAAVAIDKANSTPQDELRRTLGANDGRPEAFALASVMVAGGLGAELRSYAQWLARSAQQAPSAVQSFVRECRGCGRYFVPIWDRKKKRAHAGGRPPTYCTPQCENLKQKTTGALANKTAAARARAGRQRSVIERTKLTGETELRKLRADAQLQAEMRYENPAGYRILQKHIQGRGRYKKHRQELTTKPRPK